MALGFIYTGSTFATPDKTMTRESSPKVLISKFGDGYEQRVTDGINSLSETYSLQFKTREKEFIDDVVVFLDGKKGVTKFAFRIPESNSSGGEKEIKVVCDSYSTTYEYDNFYTLGVSLRRVYEA
jgi:phage-related protein